MLNRAIDLAEDFARRHVPHSSGIWKLLARSWHAWRACEASYLDSHFMQRRWRRRESNFNHLLEELSTRTNDFFVVQIGACDGVMLDPIHNWIRESKWRGILVEPQRVEFEKLKANYRHEQDRLIFENVAIAETDGTCTLYRIEDSAETEDWERGVASLLTEPLRFATGRLIAETVPCITFDTLLRRHRVSRIDLLQIDTEGYDFEILKQIDFRRLRPVMIRYEHRHLKTRERLACKRYLKRFGYRIIEMRFDTAAV